MDERIKRFINKTRIWVFVKITLNNFLWCFPFGVGLGMIFEIIGYFVPWYYVHRFSLGALILSLVLALIMSLIKFPSAKTAAAELDKSGLKERAQTAVELLGQDGLFAELQKRDAYRVMVGDKIRKMIPLGVTWKRPVVIAVCGFLMVTFAMLPSMAKDIAAKKYEVAKKAEEEIAKVEEVKEELEEEIAPQEMAEFQDTLKDIISEIKDAETKEEIDKSLERAETKLEQMAEKTDNEKAKEKMNELAKSLSLDRNKDTDKGQNNEVLAAAKELEEMLENVDNLSELSEEELQELLEKLENLEDIAASELSESELASLEELAEQISSGQLNNNALADAKATVSGLKSSAQILANNDNADSGNNNGQGNGDGSGDGDGNGSGSGNGNGNGNGSGSGNGGGSGNGHGGGWNYGSKDGEESDHSFGGDMVSIPNETGDDENLTGQSSDGVSFVSKGGQSLTWTGKQVEYSSVFGQYKQRALSRIQSGSYPSGVQDIIKSYFEKISN